MSCGCIHTIQIGFIQMFHSTHYAGKYMMPQFQPGEPWKKVFGPVFIYFNSAANGEDPRWLWEEAKLQVY